MKRRSIAGTPAAAGLVCLLLSAAAAPAAAGEPRGLWAVYEEALKTAKYIDLTHCLAPATPVWKGFGPSAFGPALNPETGLPYRYPKDGFEATRYELSTDQLGMEGGVTCFPGVRSLSEGRSASRQT